MKRTRSFRMLAAGVVLSLTGGFAATAITVQPASANDFQIIQDNLDEALTVLANGLSEAVNIALETQSAVEVGDQVGLAFWQFGTRLVQGTAQFGQLGFGLNMLRDAVINQILGRFLLAIDDPSTAGDIFNPDDISTIISQLAPAIDDALPHLLSAPNALLEGNLTESLFNFVPGVGHPAVLGDLVQAIAIGPIPFFSAPNGALNVLFAGTGFAGVSYVVAIANLIVAGTADSQLAPLEPNLAASLAGLAPVLGPVRALLTAVDPPSLTTVLGGGLLGLPGLGSLLG